MRCDLHVHTRFSGKCTVPLARRFCGESYTEPLDAYRRLKQAGMDLVTVTDHDSVEAAAELERFSDFFSSEEVTIMLPSGTEAHIAVYDLSAAQHHHVQRRRRDLPALLAYLSEQRLLFGINHVFSSLTGRRDPSDFDWFEAHFSLWEARNGAMLECANQFAADYAGRIGKGLTGGSDSHTLRSLAQAYTEVQGARSVREYLDGLRHGRGQVGGLSGGYRRITADVTGVAMAFLRDQPWAFPLLPFLLGIPVATFFHCWRERRFAQRWCAHLSRNIAGATIAEAIAEVAP